MSNLGIEKYEVSIARSSVVDLNNDSISVTSGSEKPLIVRPEPRVKVVKKEYSIVSDGLYASINADEAPLWLTSIIGQTVSTGLANANTSLQEANLNIVNSLNQLEIAKNNYQELINISATVDSIISSRLTSLDATLKNNNAKIVNLESSYVTPTQANAMTAGLIASSLNGGAIGARIGQVQTTLTNQIVAQATHTTVLEAEFEDVSSAVSTLENTVIANAEKAEANFAYDAKLKLKHTDGQYYYYSSGFGLKTKLQGSSTEGGAVPTGSSEFWVNADKFKIVSPVSGLLNPLNLISSSSLSFAGFLTNDPINYLPQEDGSIGFYSDTDTSIGILTPAIRVNEETSPSYLISFQLKVDNTAPNGLTYRVHEYDNDLPNGKSYVGTMFGGAEASVQSDTRMVNNQANVTPTVEWKTYEFTYTPTVTAKWASLGIIKGTSLGLGPSSIMYVKNITIRVIADSTVKSIANDTLTMEATTAGIVMNNAGKLWSNNLWYNANTSDYTTPPADLSGLSGVLLGRNEAAGSNIYQLYAGNANNYLYWNGSSLKVKGDIEGSNISGSTITGGSLNINNKFIVNSSGDTTIKSGTSGARMEIENDRIRVFDENNQLRVVIGKLS